MPQPIKNSDPSWFGFLLTVKEEAGVFRHDIVPYLENNKIQTRMLFAGNLTRHPCFDQLREKESGYRIVGNLKNTDRIMKDTFWVGVYPGMNVDQLDYMVNQVHGFVNKK